MIIVWGLIGWLTGRGFRNAALPDSVKQQRYDAALARRQQRRASTSPTFGQWLIVVVAVLFIVGLVVQAFQ